MKAIILAAGRGTRMGTLTEEKPKPMIKVNGEPFLHYLLQNVRKAGFEKIAVVVCYKKDVIAEWVAENELDIELIEQGEPQGTGHAVKACQQWVEKDDFIVLMGDNLYSEKDIAGIAKENGYCYVGGMPGLDQKKLAALVTDNGMLKEIVEKPAKPISELSNVGIYKFTPEIFRELGRIGKSPRGEYEITDAIEALCLKGKVKVWRMKGYWIDFTRPEDVRKVEEFLKNGG